MQTPTQADGTKPVLIHISPITYQKLSILAIKADTTKGAMASEAIETYIKWLLKAGAEELVNLSAEEEAIIRAKHPKYGSKHIEQMAFKRLKARYPYLKMSSMRPRKKRAANKVPRTDNVPKIDNAATMP